MKKIAVLCLLVQTATVAFSGYITHVESNGYNFVYFESDEHTTFWDMAKYHCAQVSGTKGELAMLKKKEMNEDVAEMLRAYKNPQAWLGGSDGMAEDYWKWVDGTQFVYDNWGPGQPNNGGGSDEEDCLAINVDADAPGTWSDRDCMENRGFVCQMDTAKALSLDFSQLTVYDEMPRTFWGAKKECERIGARLVEIPDEQAKEVMLGKMNSEDAKYWVDMKNVGSRCSVLNQDGSEERDCNEEEFGFICETVSPHMLKISDRNPTVSESGDIQLECSASGFPLPHVAWYKGDELLPGQSFGAASSTINIENVMPEDAGKYTCIASNTVNGEEKRTRSIARISVKPN